MVQSSRGCNMADDPKDPSALMDNLLTTHRQDILDDIRQMDEIKAIFKLKAELDEALTEVRTLQRFLEKQIIAQKASIRTLTDQQATARRGKK